MNPNCEKGEIENYHDQVGHLATRLSPAVMNSETLRTPFSLKAETVLGPVILSTVPLKASWSFWERTIFSLSHWNFWQNMKGKNERKNKFCELWIRIWLGGYIMVGTIMHSICELWLLPGLGWIGHKQLTPSLHKFGLEHFSKLKNLKLF